MRRLLPAAFLWCAFLSVPLMGCVSCTKGKFCDDSNFPVSCESCPAGKFQSSVGQRDCVTCAIGKYQREKGADACIDCSTGRYQDAEQQATCKPCEAGQSAQTEGSSACKPCPEGRYQDQSAQPECKSCTPSCPSGTYLNKDACGGQSKPNCKDCPAGKYSTMGETSCKECAEGKFQDQVAQDTCEQCPKGKYAGASAGQKDCKKCEAGKFQDEMAKFECKSCAAGQYQSQEAEAACSGCDGCPEGRFRDSCGSDSAGACSGCAAGEKKALRGDYDTKCENCTKGHYQDVTGQASCKPCVVGRYQANPGGLVCTECEQGQVQVSPQQDKCTECAAGSFQKAGGKGYCDECNVQEPCPVGKWRSSCEKESPGHCEACTSCPDKQFRSGCSGQERGQCTACAACPAGKHRSGCEKQSAGTCEVCAHGTFKSSASDSGCETCALCPAGQSYWRAGCKDADKGECDDCAEGRFRTDKNAPALCEECAVCPPGKYLHGCNATTAGECKNCTSGFFKQIAGAWNTVCEACLYACQPGQELLGCGGSNNGICTDCPSTPSTKYRDGVNASVTTCRDCEACSKEGQFRYGCTRFSGGSCVACPAAKYQDQVGGADTKCKACESCGSGAAYNPTCGGSSKGECIPLQCAEGQYVDQAKVQDSGGLVDGCTVCESCDFGKERTGCGGNSTGTCIQCQEGMFKDSGLESSNGKEWWKKCERCKGCEAGYERKSCGDTNSGTCSPCPVGKYKSSYSGEISAELKCGDCTQCAAGKYRVGCGNDIPGTCERCPPGQYKTDVGKWNDTCEKCKTCPKGQERMSCTLTSAGQCRDCQTGFYKLVAGTTMCEPCSSCGEGAVRLDCGGSYSGQCESPKQGEYKNTTGEWNTTARSCDPCDQGTHRSECGGSSPGSCKTCVGGRFKLSKGSWDSTCEDFQGCKKGLYRTNTSVISVGACTPCPAGRYKDTEGSWNTKCSECSYCGEKQRSQGCGGANRGQCSHCTVGKYNDVKSGPWHTACKLCDEGHFCSEGAMKLCPPGRYSSVPGGEECRDCSAGSFGVAYGATAANCSGLCRAGYVCTAGSKTDAPPGNKCGASAREIPALHFCPEGSSAPTQVALGFFTTPESSDEMTRTGEKMCDAGTYCEDGTQKDCPVGHRCPAKSVAPLPCGSVNVFCEQNSENATEVSAGYFTTSTSSSSEILRDAQETCAIGHQCVGGKMLPCPKGQYQDLEAQSSCKQCKKGRYGNEMGISTDACTETCPTNFYCPAGTATPLFCPKDNSTFCRQGSSEITTISLGHWIDKSGGDGNWSQKACAPGFYCPGNVRIECPAGYYCASLATAPIACGAERFYCPAGSAAKIPVALGHFSAGSNSTTNRTRQELCGAGSYYCVLGKRRQAKTGYYTAPESINATARWMEIMCEEGFRCINGTRIECDDGYKCRAGLDRQEACGSPSRFCKKGVEKLVDVGHYSIGANLQATPANADIRTDQAECPQGHFCRQGVMHECGEQGANESVFCEAGASEPKRVAEGSYSGPLHESVLTRYWSTLCACPENKTDCGAPAFDFFCAGDGKRQKMANNFTAVVLKVEMTSEGQKANNFSVVGKRPCGTRQLCKDGTAQECPDGYKCLQNTKFRCNAGDTGKFGTCTTCPDKHYELNRTECKPCPQEGVICSNGKLVTKLDYWYEFEAMRDAGRVIDANTAFYKCKFDGICSLNTTGAGSLPGLPTVNCKEGPFFSPACGSNSTQRVRLTDLRSPKILFAFCFSFVNRIRWHQMRCVCNRVRPQRW